MDDALLEQKAYIIRGVYNKGTTKFGIDWIGYNANRFSTIEDFVLENSEIEEKAILSLKELEANNG